MDIYLKSILPPKSGFYESIKSLLKKGIVHTDYAIQDVWSRYPVLQQHVVSGVYSWMNKTYTNTIKSLSWTSVKMNICNHSSLNLHLNFDGIKDTNILNYPPRYQCLYNDESKLTQTKWTKKKKHKMKNGKINNNLSYKDTKKTITVILNLTEQQVKKLTLLATAYNYIWNRAVHFIYEKTAEDVEGRAKHRLEQQQEIHQAKIQFETKSNALKLKTNEKLDKLKIQLEKYKNKNQLAKIEEIKIKRKKLRDCLLKQIKKLKLLTKRKIDKIYAKHYIPLNISKKDIRNSGKFKYYTWPENTFSFLKTTLLQEWRKYTDTTKDEAALAVVTTFKAQITKTNPNFRIKLRSRNDNYITVFGKRDFEYITQSNILGILLDKHNIPINAPSSQFKIIYNKSLKIWKLVYTVDNDLHSKCPVEETDARYECLCTDPGINMFQTGICLDTMSVYEYGSIQTLRQCIIPLVNKAEKLNRILKIARQSYFYPDRKQHLRRLHRNMMNLYNKASLRMTDAHYCIALHMCLNFKNILIPDFRVKRMARNGKLSTKLNKEFIRWSHYNFKQILIRTARRTNTIVIEGKEPYTSQTCCLCRQLVQCSGPVFKCINCNIEIPRDWGGGLNNNIVYLS